MTLLSPSLPLLAPPTPSGDWAAVFSTQQAAAADAEEIAAERRARAAEAVAARAADAPGGGGAGLQPPPEWFMQMGLLPGHLPPMMMGDEFDVSRIEVLARFERGCGSWVRVC